MCVLVGLALNINEAATKEEEGVVVVRGIDSDQVQNLYIYVRKTECAVIAKQSRFRNVP